MPRIYISYRRSDSGPYVGRLSDWLEKAFGKTSVFRDIEKITPGMDFVEAIESSVGTCDALLAVIGREWLRTTDDDGRRRLDNPGDYVRLEIAMALKRRIPIIPVLVGGAAMPPVEELPDDLQRLARIQALPVSDNRWDTDVDVLIGSLKRRLTPGPTRPPRETTGDSIQNPEGISPREAGLWSTLLPGLGQIMLGQRRKGVAILAGVLVGGTLTAGLGFIIGWPLAIYDAYSVGQRMRSGNAVGQWEFFWSAGSAAA